MNKFILLLVLVISSCNTGNLKVIADLPNKLNEASGLAISKNQDIFWMINDSGNESILYGLNSKGVIVKEIYINAKNRDWEDLTIDEKGHVYIGDFGNNNNDSKNLTILKVHKDSLNLSEKTVTPEKILFSYPEQKTFPPKKNKRHFDCESFFYYNDSLYLFTKSRSPNQKGKTNLYLLPTTPGQYSAKYISSFNTCNDNGCWVTSADINKDGTKVAVLTENRIYLFSHFKSTNFFDAEVKSFHFDYDSQKESVAFKNDSTLFITDEYLGINGGNLYEFKIN